MDLHRATILITGATGGVGTAISDYLAEQRNCTLILSDTAHNSLKQRAEQLRSRYAVTVHTLVQDMLPEGSAEQLFERATTIAPIDAMINCMGLTYVGRSDVAHIARISRINFVVASEMTLLFVRYFLEKNSYCGILHINSLAGYSIIPFQSIYAASKNALRCFCAGIRKEMKCEGKGKHIILSEIYPGPIDTEMVTKAAHFSKMSKRQQRLMTPAKDVARWAINGFERGKIAIYPHLWYIPAYLLITRFFPKIIPHFLGRSFKKLL